MELSKAAVVDQAGRGGRERAAGVRPVWPRLPDPPPAAARARAPRATAGGAADRRDRPRRRRLRGVPTRAARRRRGDDPRARDDPRDPPAGDRAHLEPDPGSARRGQTALPVPVDRLPNAVARGRDHPPPSPRASETLAVEVADAVARMRDSDVQKPPGIAEAIDWLAALNELGVEKLDADAIDRTLGSV